MQLKLLDKVLNGSLYVLNGTLCYLVSPIFHALVILGVISKTNLIEDLTDETEQAMCINCVIASMSTFTEWRRLVVAQ